MATRNLSEITDVSKLGMYDFYLETANGYEDMVVISGDRGYPHYYRVELHFFDVEYIACAPSFGNMGTFQFRYATEQETVTIHEQYLEFPPRAVYCFEEDLSRWRPMPARMARKFFIVASKVEITVHYDPENAYHLLEREKTQNE